jgi:hypothetical protein
MHQLCTGFLQVSTMLDLLTTDQPHQRRHSRLC